MMHEVSNMGTQGLGSLEMDGSLLSLLFCDGEAFEASMTEALGSELALDGGMDTSAEETDLSDDADGLSLLAAQFGSSEFVPAYHVSAGAENQTVAEIDLDSSLTLETSTDLDGALQGEKSMSADLTKEMNGKMDGLKGHAASLESGSAHLRETSGSTISGDDRTPSTLSLDLDAALDADGGLTEGLEQMNRASQQGDSTRMAGQEGEALSSNRASRSAQSSQAQFVAAAAAEGSQKPTAVSSRSQRSRSVAEVGSSQDGDELATVDEESDDSKSIDEISQEPIRTQYTEGSALDADGATMSEEDANALNSFGAQGNAGKKASGESMESDSVRAFKKKDATVKADRLEDPELDLEEIDEEVIEARFDLPEDRAVRVLVDEDLAIEVSTDGDAVDVMVEGPQEAREDVRDLAPELNESLEDSGYYLRDYSSRDGQGGGSTTHHSGEENAPASDESSTHKVLGRGRSVNVIA